MRLAPRSAAHTGAACCPDDLPRRRLARHSERPAARVRVGGETGLERVQRHLELWAQLGMNCLYFPSGCVGGPSLVFFAQLQIAISERNLDLGDRGAASIIERGAQLFAALERFESRVGVLCKELRLAFGERSASLVWREKAAQWTCLNLATRVGRELDSSRGMPARDFRSCCHDRRVQCVARDAVNAVQGWGKRRDELRGWPSIAGLASPRRSWRSATTTAKLRRAE